MTGALPAETHRAGPGPGAVKRALAVAVLGALLAVGLAAHAAAPTDHLKGTIEQVLKILQDPELRKSGKLEERRKRLRAVANEIFDWRETAKRALGRHWRLLTSQQREEVSRLFADILERTYVGRIEEYSGEQVLYKDERIEGDHATVRTRIVTEARTEVPVDYRMLKEGDRWRVYDVTIEGVSLVSNYRTQFERIIRQSGYDGLVERLKAKQDDLRAGGATPGTKRP